MIDDGALHYELMLELEQFEQDQIEEINLELNTVVSEYLLTNDLLQAYNTTKKS